MGPGDRDSEVVLALDRIAVRFVQVTPDSGVDPLPRAVGILVAVDANHSRAGREQPVGPTRGGLGPGGLGSPPSDQRGGQNTGAPGAEGGQEGAAGNAHSGSAIGASVKEGPGRRGRGQESYLPGPLGTRTPQRSVVSGQES